MNNYPPPDGYGQQGYGQQQGQAYNQGYNTQSSGPPGYNQGYGQAPPPSGNQGYDSWQPGGGQNNYSGGQSGYGGGQGNYTDGQGGMGGPPQSNSYGAPSGYQQQGSHQFSQGAPAGYPQQHGDMFGDHTGGYNPQNVPVEHLPPGYNPNTRAPYQPHELPPGAQMAGPGEEGYIPAGMSRDEAQSRGFLGSAGGGLLGMWLGHKFGKKQGHGMLGTLGGGGLGAILGGKLF